MKGGAENRKKTIIAGVLGAAALGCCFYLYNSLFGGSSGPTPPPTIAPLNGTSTSGVNGAVAARSAAVADNANGAATEKRPAGNTPTAAAGVAATKMASTSASLDPTLDQVAMLRTESLVYSGTGRNIFSLVYTPPVPKIPTNVPKARTTTPVYVPPVYVPPPTCPPSCPPINLKFFGTETRSNGVRQAFLLQGEDVYLASQGDIVAKKYLIVSISVSSIQVKDLANDNTQSLPLQAN